MVLDILEERPREGTMGHTSPELGEKSGLEWKWSPRREAALWEGQKQESQSGSQVSAV